MRKLPVVFMALLICLATGSGHAHDRRESDSIRYLITAVETLEGAVFIRNGREYDAGAAADHLRLKLRLAGDRVKTAEDFIRLCGSRSSASGEAYRIRFADGIIVAADVFFRSRLGTWPGR